MTEPRKLAQLTRQELYDLVWATPAAQLAPQFGISDVALSKRCKKQNIPKPSRGYWAKLAAGENPKKKPLPPTANEDFKQAARSRLPKNLRLPETTEPLHPLASDLANAIAKGKLDHYKRARVEEPALPRVAVSKHLAGRVAQSLHVLIKELESVGIRFRKFHGMYEGAYFARRGDRMYLTITEDITRPDGSAYPAPSWQSARPDEKSSGHLTFSLESKRWHNNKTLEWSESARLPLGRTLAQVVTGLREHFVQLQESREQQEIETARAHAEWLERRRVQEREEAIRQQQEREKNHADALTSAAHTRADDLLKAAEWWRVHRSVMDFLEECERRWRAAAAGDLTVDQQAWLTWARQHASKQSPFQSGYPDPARDGAFDPGSVPFGGPYPATRKFPLPPTLTQPPPPPPSA